MGVLVGLFLRGLLSFAAGVGFTSLVDKFVPDKLPTGTAPLYPNRDATGKINWLRFGVFVVVGAIGILLVKYIGQKLHIKLLR